MDGPASWFRGIDGVRDWLLHAAIRFRENLTGQTMGCRWRELCRFSYPKPKMEES